MVVVANLEFMRGLQIMTSIFDDFSLQRADIFKNDIFEFPQIKSFHMKY